MTFNSISMRVTAFPTYREYLRKHHARKQLQPNYQ